MNPNKALWEKGDFTKLAETMRDSAKELVASLGIKKGMKVLDLGCGDGNTALPAAQLGATVTGIDIAENLVAAGQKRIKEQGIDNCTIQQGDASNLAGLEDKSFDMVVSIFGAMFAPKPLDVAREMVRVTKPGGKIVMGNWIPGDPTLVAQILKTSAAHTPPPPEGFVSPMLWGKEEDVTQRFVAAGVPKENIEFSRETFTFSSAISTNEFLNRFKHYYGPTMNAFEAATANGKGEALHAELEQLFASQNKSANPHTTLIPATYLQVTVTV